MKYALLIDVNRCCICFACQVACKDEYVGNTYPPFSVPQPDIEQEWINVEEIEKGKYPYVKVYPVPVLCNHCDDAPCIKTCPVPGAIYHTENKLVIIDPARCKSDKCDTRPCVKGCPYGVIFYNKARKISQKCTFCAHRLEKGKEPACIDACPAGVFLFGEESKILKEALKRSAKVLHPEYKSKPRIYYAGLPSVTLAGHVVGAESLMDVVGAEVKVSESGLRLVTSCKTNVSGNFAIEDLKLNGLYNIEISGKQYKTKVFDKVKIDTEYKHLGEIKLSEA